MTQTRRSIVSPEDQSATFIELFFDLVFVFAVTQVVGLLHGGLTPASVGRALLVFWLVWWAWTQFTWALNAADTTHSLVELGTLLATAAAFFMATALPEAFGARALWFALCYVLVRLIGLALYTWVSWLDPRQRQAVIRFSLVSLSGLIAALLGGILGGAAQYWLWGLVIVLDFVAASVGGRAEGWNLRPEHFSERHGLFVIIALGESLIVAASGLTDQAWTGPLAGAGALAVAMACALWWTYFPQAKPALEHALAQQHGAEQSSLARDVYSLLHFPMLLGIIGFSFAVEEIVTHPAEPLEFAGRLALALGLLLFVGGMALALWRATGQLPLVRTGLTLLTSLIVLVLAGVGPAVSLGVALVGLVVMAGLESRTLSPRQ